MHKADKAKKRRRSRSAEHKQQTRRSSLSKTVKSDKSSGRLQGQVVKYHASRLAWLKCTDQADIAFNPQDSRLLVHGDQVVADIQVTYRSQKGRGSTRKRSAILVEIERRSQTEFPVVLYFYQDRLSIQAIGQQLADLNLESTEQLQSNKPASGTVMIARWKHPEQVSDRDHMLTILSERTIGLISDPEIASPLALAVFRIPTEWSPDSKKECALLQPELDALAQSDAPQSVNDPADRAPERLDRTNLPFVTIDGADAKDFDDAVHCTKRDSGGWKLDVAIADVSFYVRPASALDLDACQRGTSVYFHDQVVPMLPPVLSENLCSLKPHVNRRAVLCSMAILPDGSIDSYEFHRVWIRSQARLVYEQVDRILNQLDGFHTDIDASVATCLLHMEEATEALKQNRIKRQALNFDLPSISIKQDGNKQPIQIVETHRLRAHELIEDAMLAANTCAAQHVTRSGLESPMRTCEPPSQYKWLEFCQLAQSRGLETPYTEPSLKAYRQILQQLEPPATPIQEHDIPYLKRSLIRSLSYAIYETSTTKGHFPLSLKLYTHFTSPIRRYPDLLVHRLLIQSLQGPSQITAPAFNVAQLCKMSSEAEYSAENASRFAMRHLQCLMAAQNIGVWHRIRLSRLVSQGLLVYLEELHLEAWIPLSLARHYFWVDQKLNLLQTRTSNRIFRPGDQMQARIQKVQLDSHRVVLGKLRF
ncbi:MAG: VacB/RNase II family 3'-5' exoribonuclease [Gammaproteobacteria bacterium]